MSNLLEKDFEGPYFVRFFAPVLSALEKFGGSGRPAEVRDLIIEEYGITESDLTETIANGTLKFDNQVGWARFYLVKAGYIGSSKRGVWTLTEKAPKAETFAHDDALNVFQDVQKLQRDSRRDIADQTEDTGQPADAVGPQDALSEASKPYGQKVLEQLQDLSPSGFERFCQQLLRESGFEQVTVTGKSGDGGIDGIGILEVNPLVSFKVLFQCKRYAGAVTPSHVRDFRGAMQGRADKGIILTTGGFTQEAKKESVRDGVPPIELVDGEKLVKMLEQVEMGLNPKTVYELDLEFFERFK